MALPFNMFVLVRPLPTIHSLPPASSFPWPKLLREHQMPQGKVQLPEGNISLKANRAPSTWQACCRCYKERDQIKQKLLQISDCSVN